MIGSGTNDRVRNRKRRQSHTSVDAGRVERREAGTAGSVSGPGSKRRGRASRGLDRAPPLAAPDRQGGFEQLNLPPALAAGEFCLPRSVWLASPSARSFVCG
jgi:hypothetical protein